MKVAFAGPSIYPGVSVRASCCGVAWRGPARQGDIARAVDEGATAIALIDGLYGTLAAVWHKEILFALAAGVRMIGGASLGALRASECWPFGMEGVGIVYEAYANGSRIDDGDVALLHGPEELDFIPITETLVDIEATLDRLLANNLITGSDARRIAKAAAQIFFWDRTLESVCERAGLSQSLVRLIEANRVHQKRQDALLAVERLVTSPAERRPKPIAWQPSATRSFRRIATAVLAETAPII